MKHLVNNKKGIALAYVIIIGAALLILATMAALAANASIGVSDSGIKSREAYLSAKSGIEYAKIKVADTTNNAMSNLRDEILIYEEDPDHVVELEDKTYYGYGDLTNGFTMQMNGIITPTSSEFQNAPIQITYKESHHLTSTPSITSPDAITFMDEITIDVTSIGNSSELTALKIFDQGIKLTYQVQRIVTADGIIEEEEEDDPNIIPDTDGIPVNSVWPTTSKTLAKDSTFYYNGEYYFNLYRAWIPAGTTPDDYENVVLITRGIALNVEGWVGVGPYHSKTLAEFNQTYNVSTQRGDKVVYNGIYYIYRDEPSPSDWVQLPPNWPWVRIPNQ